MVFRTLFLLLFISCSIGNEKVVIHKDLIGSSNELFMEMNEEPPEMLANQESYLNRYETARYSNDTLIASLVVRVNCCTGETPQIRYSNDSLFLELVSTTDEVCTCYDYRKVDYTVVKEGIKKYVVVFFRNTYW